MYLPSHCKNFPRPWLDLAREVNNSIRSMKHICSQNRVFNNQENQIKSYPPHSRKKSIALWKKYSSSKVATKQVGTSQSIDLEVETQSALKIEFPKI